MSMEQLGNEVRASLPGSLERLKNYLRLPSVSAQRQAIPETVAYVVQMLEEIGGQAKVLDEWGGNPVIYGYFAAGPRGDSSKTILFYNHYDVQPAEPLEEWNSPPFEPTLADGKLFARGVADNKGDLVARLTAIQVLQNNGGLPCNIKFLIEGEEEIGSPNLEPYLRTYQDLFQADACIWEFGNKDESDRISMVAGIKGMAYLELTCEGAQIDLHSSVGAYVDNAAWRLVQALASMKNEKNEILVEGFYDGIVEPDAEVRLAVKELPFDEQAIMNRYGLKRPLITTAKRIDPREAMVFHPTMTICGLESGYTGEGAKTVLPKRAKAKVDCRLVPGQDPDHILVSVERHLLRHGFDDVKVSMVNGQRAYRSDYHHPFVAHVLQTARLVYDQEPVLAPNAAGTGPMYAFGKLLNLPIVSTGVGWAGSQVHAPNESIRLGDYEQGIMHMVLMLAGFSQAVKTAEMHS